MITKSELDKIVEKLHDVPSTQEGVNLFYRCYFRVWNCLNVYVDSEKTRKCLEHDLLIMQGLYAKTIQKWNMYGPKKENVHKQLWETMKNIVSNNRCSSLGSTSDYADGRRTAYDEMFIFMKTLEKTLGVDEK